MTPGIYKETILDHFRHPRNYGDLPDANARAKDSNVLCGDVIEIQLRIKVNRIDEARFRGEGCAISIATASMLTEFAKGKSISEIKKLGKEELIKLLGADPGPGRIECALLGLEVLKAALDGEQSSRASEELAH